MVYDKETITMPMKEFDLITRRSSLNAQYSIDAEAKFYNLLGKLQEEAKEDNMETKILYYLESIFFEHTAIFTGREVFVIDIHAYNYDREYYDMKDKIDEIFENFCTACDTLEAIDGALLVNGCKYRVPGLKKENVTIASYDLEQYRCLAYREYMHSMKYD